MRVLWVSLADEMSGAERSMLEILRHTPGEHVVASPPGRFAAELRTAGYSVRPIPSWRPTLRGGWWQWVAASPAMIRLARGIARIATAERVDVVAANGLRAGLAARVAPMGSPLVWAIRDNLPPGILGRVARTLARGVTAVANSQYIARQWAGGRTEVIYPGIGWAPAQGGLRSELGLGAGTPLIGIVGQITPWKRQHDALAAARLARRDIPDLHLVVCGSAKFRTTNHAYLEQLRAEAARDGGRTIFLGERADLYRIYPELDALLVPSDNEPFGRVAAEALGYGTPVVASAAGGLSEIVCSRARGHLVPTGDIQAMAEAIVASVVGQVRVPPAESAAVRIEFSAASAGRRWALLLQDARNRTRATTTQVWVREGIAP